MSRAVLRAVLISTISSLTPLASWAADKVSLNYQWPAGLQASVSGAQTKEKFVNGQAQSAVKTDMSYTMVTETHEQGLVISYSDVSTSVDSGNAAAQGWLKNYMELISESLPSLTVGRNGQFLGAAGLPELKSRLMTSLKSLLGELPEQQRNQILTGVDKFYSEETINVQLQSQWNNIVGQWVGAEFEKGGVYETEYETPIPALGNQTIKTIAQYQFVDRVNCDDTDTANRCVRLAFHSETDKISASELLSRLVPEGVSVPDIEISVVSDLIVVTDPNTLLPYYTQHIKRSSSPLNSPQGMVSAMQVQASEFTYSYTSQ